MSFVIDMLDAGQKLAKYIPRVEFRLDMNVSASKIPQLTLNMLCSVFIHLSNEFPHEFFNCLLACRRTCQTLWNFFFSATGTNVPVPPLIKSNDLERMGLLLNRRPMQPYMNYYRSLHHEFTCNYSQFFYLLLETSLSTHRVDYSSVRRIYIDDDVYSLRLILDSGAFEVEVMDADGHYIVHNYKKTPFWPPKRFPVRCYEFLKNKGYTYRSTSSLVRLFLDENAIYTSFRDIADVCLFSQVHHHESGMGIFYNTEFPPTEKLFKYFPKDGLMSCLSFGYTPTGVRDYTQMVYTICAQWALSLSPFGVRQQARGRLATHIRELYALANMQVPILLQLMFQTPRKIKINSQTLASEPLWPTDFCLDWLDENACQRRNQDMQICFYILFCLSYGTRQMRKTFIGPQLQDAVFAQCLAQISKNMRAQIPVEWFGSLTLGNLELHREQLLALAGEQAFTPVKRKTNAVHSEAKRRK